MQQQNLNFIIKNFIGNYINLKSYPHMPASKRITILLSSIWHPSCISLLSLEMATGSRRCRLRPVGWWSHSSSIATTDIIEAGTRTIRANGRVIRVTGMWMYCVRVRKGSFLVLFLSRIRLILSLQLSFEFRAFIAKNLKEVFHVVLFVAFTM